MSNRAVLVSTLLVISAVLNAAQSQTSPASCPSEAPVMRRIATRFAHAPMYLEARSIHQLPTLDSTQVRTLTLEAGDGMACTKLLQLVQASDTALASAGFRLTFFQAGDHYYIVGVPADKVTPPPRGEELRPSFRSSCGYADPSTRRLHEPAHESVEPSDPPTVNIRVWCYKISIYNAICAQQT